jgi:RNA polymerase sigma factor (TIGR02999 family)
MRRESVPSFQCSIRLTEMMDAAAYERLHVTARSILRMETREPRWEPAELVHEAFVRIARSQPPVNFFDATHFHAVAVLTMRRILIDRGRSAQANCGPRYEPLDVEVTAPALGDWNSIAVREVLSHLAAHEGRLYLVVEMRFYWGFEIGEIASALSLSTRTVKRDWKAARIWLRSALGPSCSSGIRPAALPGTHT